MTGPSPPVPSTPYNRLAASLTGVIVAEPLTELGSPEGRTSMTVVPALCHCGPEGETAMYTPGSRPSAPAPGRGHRRKTSRPAPPLAGQPARAAHRARARGPVVRGPGPFQRRGRRQAVLNPLTQDPCKPDDEQAEAPVTAPSLSLSLMRRAWSSRAVLLRTVSWPGDEPST